MKRYLAVLLTLLYVSFLSGSTLVEAGRNFSTDKIVAGTEGDTSKESQEEDELSTVRLIGTAKHVASFIKVKVSRTGIPACQRVQQVTASNIQPLHRYAVNTSPYYNTPLIIRHCVFRI